MIFYNLDGEEIVADDLPFIIERFLSDLARVNLTRTANLKAIRHGYRIKGKLGWLQVNKKFLPKVKQIFIDTKHNKMRFDYDSKNIHLNTESIYYLSTA